MLAQLKKLAKTLRQFNITAPELHYLIRRASNEIQVGDLVQITKGRERGRRGTISEIHPEENWAIIQFAPGYQANGQMEDSVNYDELIRVEDIPEEFEKNLYNSEPSDVFEKYGPIMDQLSDQNYNTMLRYIKNIYSTLSSSDIYKLIPVIQQNPELLNTKILNPERIMAYFVDHASDNDFGEDSFLNIFSEGFLRECFQAMRPNDQRNFIFNYFNGLSTAGFHSANALANRLLGMQGPVNDFKINFIQNYQKFPNFIEFLLVWLANNCPELYFDYNLENVLNPDSIEYKGFELKPTKIISPEAVAYQIFTKDPMTFIKRNLFQDYPSFQEYEQIDLGRTSPESERDTKTRAIEFILRDPDLLKNSRPNREKLYFLLNNNFLDKSQIQKIIFGIISKPESEVHHYLHDLINSRSYFKTDGIEFTWKIFVAAAQNEKYNLIFNQDLEEIFKDDAYQLAKKVWEEKPDVFMDLKLNRHDMYRKFMFKVGDEVYIPFNSKPHIITEYNPTTGDMRVCLQKEDPATCQRSTAERVKLKSETKF